MTTPLRCDINAEAGWFLGMDVNLTIVVYAAGTTQEQIDAGTAVKADITGQALSWMLKRSVDDPDSKAAIAAKTTAGGGISLTDPTNGECKVTIPAADTDTLLPGTYVHELKRTTSGFEMVYGQDTVELRRGVHRV